MNTAYDKDAYKAQKKAETEKMFATLRDKLLDPTAVLEFVEKKLFTLKGLNIPCMRWSMGNQFQVLMSDTFDARGFDQWHQVGRHVRRGAHALHILVPVFAPKGANEDAEEKPSFVRYFKSVPVFRAEDTEGVPLPYADQLAELRSHTPDALPLIDVAKTLGIEVEYSFSTGMYYGSYSPCTGITLCTDSEQTFLHELAHAIDDKLGNLTHGVRQDQMNEIVAEYTACVLAQMYGKSANLGYTQKYIASYTGSSQAATLLAKALERCLAIIEYIQSVHKEVKTI
jgi:antirestriction protein ArdC